MEIDLNENPDFNKDGVTTELSSLKSYQKDKKKRKRSDKYRRTG